jgi:thioredoxin-like negative regulator of GroEL
MEIHSKKELDQLVNHTDAALIYFYSDSCAPCKSLRPKVHELMETEFSKMQLVMVDAEQYPSLAASQQVFSLPVIIMFFEGKEFLRFGKYVSVAELRESIGRIYRLYYS